MKGLVAAMGYYDQDYEKKPQKQKGNSGGWFIAGLTGAILGAFIILFSFPFLAEWGFIPQNFAANQAEEEEPTDDTNEAGPVIPQQKINVDVVTQVTNAVDKVSEAVVGVINIQRTGFWGNEAGEAGTGSGVIYKKENGLAFIVTNHHVIQGASEVEVILSDGERVPAKVLGSDIFTDLAVLQIDAKHVDKVAEVGSSENLRPGEPVIAIGNPLGMQFSGSVTQGIISGLNRTIPIDLDQNGTPDWHSEVIQTDAAINPGNSGGALVNINGQLIGINSMKIAREEVEGIGLAIPISIAKPIIDDLEMYGEVRRPYMGISSRSLEEVSSYHWQETLKLPPDVQSGVFIVGVVPLSPAEQAGLKELDVIVKLDDTPIANIIELRKYLYNKKEVGDRMQVTIYRQGEKMTLDMILAEEQTAY